MDLTTTSTPSHTDRIERFQSLQAGQYWRSLQLIEDEGIEQGEVLLIQSIRWVEDKPHTIILRPHPHKLRADIKFKPNEHRFLLQNFLTLFAHEPDYQSVRNREIREVQGRVNDLQAELLEAQSNPALLATVVQEQLHQSNENAQIGTADTQGTPPSKGGAVSCAHANSALAGLATGTVAQAIEAGITEKSIASLRESAQREHQIATIKYNWIQSKTQEIASTIQALTPFYEEQAAAALARTEDVRSYVTKLMQGIESLDLYVGKDVEVLTIQKGRGAPSDVPLSFVQKKLLMDEELAVWADVDEFFDFSSAERFYEALRQHPGLVDQIFPTERCILVMAVSRRHIDYGDTWTNVARNEQNQNVFLLVRDGENIHRVWSPVESHLGADRLFPTLGEHDKIFQGLDGETIKFEDVAYTDRLSAHERSALHYKRFLLLVCGLDHRLKLFGQFYDGPDSLDFVSLQFQSRYLRFIHDDDGAFTLQSERRLSLDEWINEKNAYMRAGSRVLCDWNAVMDPDTAPAACKSDFRGDSMERRYTADERATVAITYLSGQSVCVDVPVTGYKYGSHERRSFNCKVNLSRFRLHNWNNADLAYLCLDAVSVQELQWYISNRETRKNHLSVIRFLKRAVQFLQAERESEYDTRERMALALEEGAIASGTQAQEIVDRTVTAWRAANRGKALPKFDGDAAPRVWKSLLDQMYMLAGEGAAQVERVAALIVQNGYRPLRLVLSGASTLVVYAEPSQMERDDRVESHAWVHRITLGQKKTGLTEKSRRWQILPKSSASETTLHEWPEAKEWAGKTSLFDSFEKKQTLFAATQGAVNKLAAIKTPMDPHVHASLMSNWKRVRDDANATAKMVFEPCLAVPIGLVARSGRLRFLCVGILNAHDHLLYSAPTPDGFSKAWVSKEFVRLYADKAYANQRIQSSHKDAHPWQLFELSVEFDPSRNGYYSDFGPRNVVTRHECPDPLIQGQFQCWMSQIGSSGYWVTPDVFDGEKSVVLDDVMGIVRPEDYDPVHVIHVKVGSDRARPQARWFDIVPHGMSSNVVHAALLEQGAGNAGYESSPLGVFASRNLAREFIKDRMSQEGAAVHVGDEVDFIAPPEVERWKVR